MGGVARLVEQELGAPRDDAFAELHEGGQHVAQRHQLRPAAVERDHIGAEAGLHGGEAPELVQHHVGHRVAPQFDDDAHAVAVALVAQIGDALDLLFAHEFGDALDQRRLVDLIGDLGDDQRLAVLAQRFRADPRPHDDRAASGRVGGADAGAAEDEAAGREIRAGQHFHQLLDRGVRLVHHQEHRVDALAEIVRRNVGGHADGDAAGAVDEQIGEAGRQDGRLQLLLVVVRPEIDGVLVEIVEHGHRDLLEPRFGVTIGRRGVAVDGAEIALAVDQRRAHREILRHAHHRVVDGDVAMRMESADRVADGAGAFVVGPVGREILLVHRKQDAPMHGLQTVAHVGQGAADDDAHRVIEIAALHLVEDGDGLDVGGVRRLFGLVVAQGNFRGDSIEASLSRSRRERLLAHCLESFVVSEP